MTPVRMLWILACAATLAGCGTVDDEDGLDRLREQRRRWDSLGWTSYSYVLQRLCFCGDIDPVRIVVVNGARQSATYVNSGEPVREQSLQFYPSMTGLFDMLEDAYRRADEIAVTYDATLGFPTRADIDYIERAVDDELTMIVTEVSPLRD